MKDDFGNIGRKMPYDLPAGAFDALHDRIRERIAAQDARGRERTGRGAAGRELAGRWAAGALRNFALRRSVLRLGVMAAVLLLIAGAAALHRLRTPFPETTPDLEQLLTTASAETLRQAAAENYDDLFYNQQL